MDIPQKTNTAENKYHLSPSGSGSFFVSKKADLLKQRSCGSINNVQGEIAFSNYCSETCDFCENNVNNFALKRERLSNDKILEIGRQISNIGVKSVLLRCGKDEYFDTERISYLIYTLKQQNDFEITLSFGQNRFDDYDTWRIAGANGYLLHYGNINSRPNNDEDRLLTYKDHIKYLKKLGYNIGFELNVESTSLENDRIENLFYDIKDFGIESLLIREKYDNLGMEEDKNVKYHFNNLLKTISQARLLGVSQNISYVNYYCELHGDSLLGLKSGANSIVFDFSSKFVDDYDFTSARETGQKLFNEKRDLINQSWKINKITRDSQVLF